MLSQIAQVVNLISSFDSNRVDEAFAKKMNHGGGGNAKKNNCGHNYDLKIIDNEAF